MKRKIEDLRDYYDTHDTAKELETALDRGEGVWETNVEEDPLVGTSLRLPKSILDRIRAEARTRQMPATALMRLLIVQGLTQQGTAAVDQVRRQLDDLRGDVNALRDELRRSVPRSAATRRSAARSTKAARAMLGRKNKAA
jgi:hypothetical protein